jgi:hypothetical protein
VFALGAPCFDGQTLLERAVAHSIAECAEVDAFRRRLVALRYRFSPVAVQANIPIRVLPFAKLSVLPQSAILK